MQWCILYTRFALVESCLSSVGSREDQAVNAVRQFYLMEIDEQPKGDIQPFHVAQELCSVDGQDLLNGLCLPLTRILPPGYRIAGAPLA